MERPRDFRSFVDVVRARADGGSGTAGYTLLDANLEQLGSLRYADIDASARAISTAIGGSSMRGERALLLFPPGLEYIAAFLGCLYAGAIAVPAYPPTSPRDRGRLLGIVRSARPSVVCTSHELAHPVDEWIGGFPELAGARCVVTDRVDSQAADEWTDCGIGRGDVAFLQYTSGSTGDPKGVRVTHGNLLHDLEQIHSAFGLSPQSRSLSWLPPYHDMGLMGGLLEPLYGEIRTWLMSPLSFVRRPISWLRAISRHRIGVSGGPNFSYALCLRHVRERDLEELDLSSWEIAFNGAEPVHAETLDAFSRRFETCGFRREAFYPCYGLAESTLIVTGGDRRAAPLQPRFQAAALERGEAVAATQEAEGRRLVGCGQPTDLDVRIVDPATRETCRPGRVGEIWVRGASVADGYWQRPATTAAVFGGRLAGSEEGPFLRTGDLGFFDRGELFVAGRIKDVVIVDGRNHHPQDIEATVQECHPSLRPGCGAAFAIDDGEGEGLVVVQEITRGGAGSLHAPALFRTLRGAIAEQHGLEARSLVLVEQSSLSKTTSGKMQRSIARRRFLAGELREVARFDARETARSLAPAEAATEPDSIEGRIAHCVGLAIGHPASGVDPDVPFAEHGLGSLAMIELSSALETSLQRPVDPILLYSHPTVRSLARFLEGGEKGRTSRAPAHRAGVSRAPDPDEGVAVIGIGCRLPGGVDGPASYWELLSGGVDAVAEVPPERWDADAVFDPRPATPDRTYSRWGGFLDRVDAFDPEFFGISPREAAAIDPQQRLLLMVAHEALEHAGCPPDRLRGSDVGVFVGISSNDYARLQVGVPGALDAHAVAGNALSLAANRLSYTFDFRGPSVAIDTACSSSLVAVHWARRSLSEGECDVALCGGVSLMLTPDLTVGLSQARMMAIDGRCRTFDADASGYVRGEGCGLLVLRRTADAVRAGDRILAVLHGSAINQDGRSNGLTAPNGAAQAAVIRRALASGGIAPESVQYVEAHGTGTPLGDPIEMGALAEVFAAGRSAERPLRIGSVKTNLGHLEAAAGIAGAIKTVLALQHAQIPPHLHLARPSPTIPWDDLPVEVPRDLVGWPSGSDRRVAGVSSFGFGGTNAHVVLGEAPLVAEPARTAEEEPLDAPQVLMLSARSATALRVHARNVAAWLQRDRDSSVGLEDVCFTVNERRERHPHRIGVAARSCADLIAGLRARAEEDLVPPPDGRLRLAFLFSGQGAQYAGMGRRLDETQPVFRDVLDRCSPAVERVTGATVRELLWGRASARISETALTQPAIFVLEVALFELWRSAGVSPCAVLGHSVGEYAAAYAAGVFDLDAGLELVLARGQAMQALSPGRMAATSASRERVEAVCARANGRLAIAAYNGSGQTVLSGEPRAVEQACAELRAEGAGVRLLDVSRAFHSPLVEPALQPLRDAIESLSLSAPHLPLIANLHGAVAGAEVAGPDYWVDHTRKPVRFDACVRALEQLGCTHFLEVGPGAPLISLVRGLVPGRPNCFVASLRRPVPEPDQLAQAAAMLFEAGAPVQSSALFRSKGSRRVVDVPPHPFLCQSYWAPTAARRAKPAVERVSDAGRDSAGDLLQLVWQPIDAVPPAAGAEGTWLLVTDTCPVADALADCLREAGAHVLLLRTADDAERSAALVREHAESLRGVVHLRGLEAEATSLGEAELTGLPSLVRGIAEGLAAGDARLWIVTRGAVAVTATDGLAPAQAALWGLGRTIGLEEPERFGGLLDLDPEGSRDAAEASVILARLLAPHDEDQVAIRGDLAYAARLTAAAAPKGRGLLVRPDVSYLVTGGTGGLGLCVAGRLVERGARSLVLASRRGGDTPEIEAQLERLRVRGARVEVARVDVSDERAVDLLFDRFEEELPPLAGVVHAAGVSGGQVPVRELEASTLATVMAAKVRGAWNLHARARRSRLDFFVAFSSVAAVWGSTGQGHYAAANAYLESVMRLRRSEGHPALTLQLGPVADVGMAADSPWTGTLARSGVGALAPDEVLGVFESLGAEGGEMIVAALDPERLATLFSLRRSRRLFDLLVRQAPDPAGARLVPQARDRLPAPGGPDPRADLAALKPAARRRALVTLVRETVAEVLGLSDPESLDPRRGFSDLGMDSLLAIEIRDRLRDALALDLPSTVTFDFPTAVALADELARALGPEAEAPRQAGGDRSGAAPPIEAVSESEAERLLVEKLDRLGVAS